MSEQDDNWFGSWLSAAKDKSSKVLEFVKKDLEEFGNAVKNEASSVVNSTGSVLEKTLKLDSPDSTASTVKRSFSSFLGQMNTVLNPSPDDSDTEAIMIIEDCETVILTPLQKAIYELQKNAETFVKDPGEELDKKYQCWLEIIDDQLSEDRINKQLQSSAVLRKQYENLVPELVPHNLFWRRYLFKKALIEDDIAHTEAMEKKEKKEKMMSENNVTWGKDDLAPYIHLTEAEQMKLLEEYENEIKDKGKANPSRENSTEKSDDEDKNNGTSSRTINEKEPNTATYNKIDEVDSAISLDANSDSSTDGDWEKITEIDK